MDFQQALMQILFGKAMGESPADAQLNQAGSVMGSQRTQQRESETRQGPLLSTVSKAVDFANPINWMGSMGGSAAAIAPTGNKMLQGLLEALRQRAPKLMQQVDDTGRMVFPYLVSPESMPKRGAMGVYSHVNPLAGNVHISTNHPNWNEMVSTGGHELRHFLTDPTLATKKPGHAQETAQQLSRMMPVKQRGGMAQYNQPFEANPAATNIQPSQQDDALRAYNESLSYLTEALLGGNKGGDPALEAVANALGQGIR